MTPEVLSNLSYPTSL